MSHEFDLVIRGGTIVDGSGKPSRTGDVAIKDGIIAAVGKVDGTGREEIDAAGRLVTPGFIDLHTHYDGQVTWEHTLAPSSNHGVTTVVMGNCGVGFAPCRADDRQKLIKLMEGVEDVPEVVMAEGIPWNWETFPEYLDALAERQFDIDVAAQVPHSALRVFAMGERGVNREEATADDRARMRGLVAEAVRAGAWGIATSRLLAHRSSDGDQIPSHGSTIEELKELARGLSDAGAGVFQMVPDVQNQPSSEIQVLREVTSASGRPASFSLAQSGTGDVANYWRIFLAEMAKARQEGLTIKGQVFPRPVGMLMGLDLSFNPLCRRPSWKEIANLPLAGKVERLRDPAFRARILSETDTPHVLPIVNMTVDKLPLATVLEDVPNYLPREEDTIGFLAKAAGKDPVEFALDRMLEREGARVIYLPAANYVNYSTEAISAFLQSPDCLLGLGDGGAHYGLVCDASYPTTMLTRWIGCEDGLSIEQAIVKLCAEPAEHMGMADRGRLEPGRIADVNIIDLDGLKMHPPRVVRDLPTGGRRIRQEADGYDFTIKRGVVTYRGGKATGALPGRLVRSSEMAPVEREAVPA